MGDFFGGITDSLRSLGDTADDFLSDNSSTLIKAVGNAAKAGGYTTPNGKVSLNDGLVGVGSNQARQTQAVRPAQSADFVDIEQQWLRRIQRFAAMDTNTKVQEGSFSVA